MIDFDKNGQILAFDFGCLEIFFFFFFFFVEPDRLVDLWLFQSTTMVMASGKPVPFISNWISGRGRTTVERISWLISTKECCRTWSSITRLSAYQVDARTSERATAPGLNYLVKRRMLCGIFAQSTYLENYMTIYKTLLRNRNIRLCAKVLLLLGNHRTDYDTV